MSAESSLPLTGSIAFSIMYFSISRLSNIAPDTGDMTGCSGTSLETTEKLNTCIFNKEIVLTSLCLYLMAAKIVFYRARGIIGQRRAGLTLKF
jgi:hypothetical protein